MSARPTLGRRTLLGTLAGAALAGCHDSPQAPVATRGSTPSTVPTSPDNPFGAAPSSAVELWADDGHRPADWARGLAQAAGGNAPTRLQVEVHTTGQLAADLAERLAGDDPPELVLSGGIDPLPLAQIAGRLADLAPVLDAVPAGGSSLRSRLRPGLLAGTTLGGHVVGIPSSLAIGGLWYSQDLFGRHGWTPPATWDELVALGRAVRTIGLHLSCWGRETATWFQRLAVASAVKQGGRDVQASLDALDGDCWRQPVVREALERTRQLVTEGLLRPGGDTRPWREAATAWSRERTVLLVPATSTVIGALRPDDAFALDVVGDPSLGTSPALGAHALHARGEDTWVAPAHAANPAGGRELLRQAMAATTASATATALQLPSSLADAPGTGALLARQEALLRAAGTSTFALDALSAYGTGHDFRALWNGFLSGRLDVATMVAESQHLTDLLRADPAVTRLGR